MKTVLLRPPYYVYPNAIKAMNVLARVAAFAGHTWGAVWQQNEYPTDRDLSEANISEWVQQHATPGLCGWGVLTPKLEDYGAFVRIKLAVGRAVLVYAVASDSGVGPFVIELTSRGDVDRGSLRFHGAQWEYQPPSGFALPGRLRGKDIARFIRFACLVLGAGEEDREELTAYFENEVFGGVTADRYYLSARNCGYLLTGETDPDLVIEEARAELEAGFPGAARAALLALDDEEFAARVLTPLLASA